MTIGRIIIAAWVVLLVGAAVGLTGAGSGDEPTSRVSEEKIRAGDKLEVVIDDLYGLGTGQTLLTPVVAENGEIELPYAKAIVVAGKTTEETEAAIKQAYIDAKVAKLAQVLVTWPTTRPDAEIRWVKDLDKKNTVYECVVDLKMENKHDFPVWFILCDRANHMLNPKGDFPMSGWDYHNGQPVDATQFDSGHGRAVIVDYRGDNGFRALRVPGHGKVEFRDFVIGATKPVFMLSVAEAKSIEVNGKTPLEEWLPYDAACDEGAVIEGYEDPLKQKTMTSQMGKAYRKEEVHSMKADFLGRGAIMIDKN